MMPAAPPPAPNPLRAPLPTRRNPMPVLWLGRGTPGPIIPTIGKNWIN